MDTRWFSISIIRDSTYLAVTEIKQNARGAWEVGESKKSENIEKARALIPKEHVGIARDLRSGLSILEWWVPKTSKFAQISEELIERGI
ncbi:MAG: hypothetical protein EOP04_02145 [Proteobacteria bacterium]|nr:MAG: hypothetical protein EOP04_02145 [Pseudomonadota bacterium]